jgi:lysophospholipase L1-like esterase
MKNSIIAILLLVLSPLIWENPFCLESNKMETTFIEGNGFQQDSARRINTTRTFLALGDSYTIGESVSMDENYPNQTAAILNKQGMNFLKPEIIATTGWTTSNLLNALKVAKNLNTHYDIVTLLIGVNNQYQGGALSDYGTDFRALLEKSLTYAENKASHVIVISIPDYSGTPFVSDRNDRSLISGQIDSFNLINKEIAGQYGVNYLNVTKESRYAFKDKSLLAFDGLHYSAKEYAIWSDLLAPIIIRVVK